MTDSKKKQEILLEWLMIRDRQWFRAHPEQTSYIREFIKGEVPGELLQSNPKGVLVTKIEDGFRIREFIV